MAFFEQLEDTISTMGREVTDKAKTLAEIAGLKGQITTCEDIIKKNTARCRKLPLKNSSKPLRMHR